MASTVTAPTGNDQQMSGISKSEGNLDLDWLLHKRDPPGSLKRQKSNTTTPDRPTEPSETQLNKEHVPKPAPVFAKEDSVDPFHIPEPESPTSGAAQRNVPTIIAPREDAVQPQTPTKAQIPPLKNSPLSDNSKQQQQYQQQQDRGGMKKESRRSSFFSGITSKFSSSSNHTPRNSSVDSNRSNKSPMPSPALERSNPFDTSRPSSRDSKDKKEEKIVITPKSMPRRPSVLVAAGTETKLDNNSPGFLSSALRRLSSSNNVTLGKQSTTSGAIVSRKIMNVDQNRQRTRIKEFDQNRLRRVAFKVDVEIAGISAQADEADHDAPASAQAVGSPPAASGKDTKMAKYKDRSEGAALKKFTSREETDPEQHDHRRMSDALEAEAAEEEKRRAQKQEDGKTESVEDKEADKAQEVADGEKPMTRKKEKKKRSEAERKERKERKRRHAEANGLVPLELTIDDDDSDSSSSTPPGELAVKKGQPTIDPLRIYKRCCQLRETTALTTVKEQIQKPSATLAEAPGTVASIDLSGTEMTLADVQTLGDWLALVPVRRLILDDCDLSDEAIRIILACLSGCKSQDQVKSNKKLPRRGSGKSGTEQMGVVEKLSLKNNVTISAIGWRHIGLFIHMCRSLRAIDLSGIPFPATAGAELRRTSLTTTGNITSQEPPPKHVDLSSLFARALAERFGDQLEELIMSGCGLGAHAISEIVDSSIKRKVKRLGLAHNRLNASAVEHIVRYVKSGVCEGLDLGGNDLKGAGHLLTEVLDPSNPLFAMSLADCNLAVDDLRACLEHLSHLQNFKFIDLSRNRALFEDPNDAVSLLRRRLPTMKSLKRIHLADVGMTPDQLISLSEILPDVPALAHVSVLENVKVIECMNSSKAESQEEACAVFVSLMSAVRASKTLVAVEIEVPSHDSTEVVRALASQVVAYSLRNLERTTLNDFGVGNAMPEYLDKNAPEVLLHLVGHMDGYSENHDNDEPAPDEDYMIASTGIVKALGVCLENNVRSSSHNASPSVSGTATPTTRSAPLRPQTVKKPKDVALELCESARKIRLRLRPAMIKEDRAGNAEAYRRLVYLDQTLEGMIKRFEDEYPESRPKETPTMLSDVTRQSSYVEGQTPELSQVTSLDLDPAQQTFSNEDDPYDVKLARNASNTSLAVRNLTQEEGRMHRFGQQMRREILKPTGTDDMLHGTSVNDAPEPEHIAAVRKRLEGYNGDFIRKEIEAKGADQVIKELGVNVQELRALEQEDPEAFATLSEAQVKAQINAGIQ